MIDTAHTPEMSVYSNKTTQCYIPENSNPLNTLLYQLSINFTEPSTSKKTAFTLSNPLLYLVYDSRKSYFSSLQGPARKSDNLKIKTSKLKLVLVIHHVFK
jgi:hypothetical protein